MVQNQYSVVHHLLFSWYKKHARVLPWRELKDPYLIWISEVMLQQTQVSTVIPYFKKWTQVFPDIFHLYEVSEEDVLKLWEGLGYYSRARNIKRTAKILVEKYGGKLPQQILDLKSLPGIGEYIAAAIASIAFGQAVPALEANGIRVMARLTDFHGEVNRSESKKNLKYTLNEIIKFGKAGELNQAIMDLGSVICLVKNPKCNACPLKDCCKANKNNTQQILPIKKKKQPIPHIIVVAGVIQDRSKVLIAKRMPNKLLGGLWEFPGGKVENDETHQEALSRELLEELGVDTDIGKKFGRYDHAYTHFSVTVYAYITKILSGRLKKIEVADFKWIDITALSNVPMGKVDRRISIDLFDQQDIDSNI